MPVQFPIGTCISNIISLLIVQIVAKLAIPAILRLKTGGPILLIIVIIIPTEQMNGSIEVTSQVGVGSVFVITIPFEIAQEQKKDEEIAEKYDIRGLHLLAAEDNELNAEIIEMLLTDDGAKVTVAKNGRQAVEHFENNPPGTFDAILMDVMMPVMDGIAATKAIRAMDRPDAKTIPIIAMTANAFEEDAKRCLAAGMTAHLAKPFQIEDVEKTIVECCGK